MTRMHCFRLAAASLIFAVAALAQAADQALRLPFEGRWFVAQGGDTLNVNQHMAEPAQAFGIDFVKVGGASNRELSLPNARRIEDYYSWGQPVLAPVQGEVVALVNDRPDNALGMKDAVHPAGNFVVIRTASHRYVFLAHFQRGSLVVKRGERVAAGQLLARCGNSGNTDFPHVHLHVQDQPELNTGQGQMPVFLNIKVELSGKTFEHVDWPLTRGMFVSKD